ncbi:MFS transporter [Streptomyces sp. CBMA123]|uniref:MFS transporter n=1 Tax=Streptomyces sp. CBMA123 TaxID=1896313 RepID=UPI001661B5CB|nr:MFS transporter [Streptomyces sp. CBMA123]MBD0690665.1 MFS transporter [Streptomyces sp. CBMA123]
MTEAISLVDAKQEEGREPDRGPGQEPPKASWLPMAAVGVAQLMVMLDSTVVNVALPSIGTDLPADQTALQWTISAYVLMYGSLLLFGGRLADVIGRRRSFLSGLVLFAVASVLCGVAGNQELLVAGRVLQGLGAAVLSAAALSIVVTVYQNEEQRKAALATWSGLGVIGAILGAVLGGLIVSAASWRWAFLINIPISLASGIIGLRSLAPMRSDVRRPLRLPTAFLATLGLACLSFGLIRLHDGMTSPTAWISMGLSVVLLAVVAVTELGKSDPLLPLHLLRIPTYWLSSLGLLLAAIVMMGSSYLASNYFQGAHDMSAFATGLAMLPMGLAALVFATVVPNLIAKVGPGGTYLIGALTQIAGAAVLITGPSNTAVAIIALTVIGAGLPTCFVPLYGVGTAHVRPEESGVGSGLLNTFNESGAALGIAVIGTVLATSVDGELESGAAAADAMTIGVGNGFLAVGICAALAACIAVGLHRLTRATQAGAETTES